MNITISNNLILESIPDLLFKELETRLSFENPKWIENQKMDRWQGNTPQFLTFYQQDLDGNLIIHPRGFSRQLLKICKRLHVNYKILDNRRTLPEVGFNFQGTLKPFQEQAVEVISKREFGVLSAPTGSGKSPMALWLIAQRKQPALVVVHTKELLFQWQSRACQFLDIDKDEIGLIGDGQKTFGNRLTIGIVNSIYKLKMELVPRIGFLIVDECPHVSSRTLSEAVSAFDSRYMLGLSATPYRRDGLTKLIYWFLGDLVHKIDKPDLVQTGDLVPAKIVVRNTDFEPFFDPSAEYSKMLSELTGDPGRNQLIVSDVAKESRNGSGICLILSDRKCHCQVLQDMLRNRGIECELLTGDLANGERKRVVNGLNIGEIKVVVATGQLIGEGFDCKALSTLFLATPIRFKGRLIQYLGRVLRPAKGKDRAVVYDYLDKNVGVLRAGFRARWGGQRIEEGS